MLLCSQQKFYPQQNGKKGHTPRHTTEVCYSPCFMNLYLMSILYCFLTSWTKCRRAMESDVLDKRPLFCTAGHCCALSSGAPTYASHDAVGVVLEAEIGCATYIYIYIYICYACFIIIVFNVLKHLLSSLVLHRDTQFAVVDCFVVCMYFLYFALFGVVFLRGGAYMQGMRVCEGQGVCRISHVAV
ncbi:hypothetical protein Tc00.1047053509957.10 [Trypanosoma cruzi]|uniref:Uncharacterized protein n=1 Tax=Trypanosoma cruzi (strain CL Brener) TaxID=353153 RepID=Q4CSK2_TRYCC|nr:hypothetical protein Tc00.1047053509957.10 [Trypanosoma cruzi]EAN83253.1 hypothetical protein Tc00.1047053509957.10 [Trypanosoma cruzi]|eukprot:XP_805104.1 hypothetical protein [Trypanosoma cruzi strain CL Brener]